MTDETSPHQITVERRADDFMAYLDGDKRYWESGKTATEAIGKLIIPATNMLPRRLPTIPAAEVAPGMQIQAGLPHRIVTVESVRWLAEGDFNFDPEQPRVEITHDGGRSTLPPGDPVSVYPGGVAVWAARQWVHGLPRRRQDTLDGDKTRWESG